MNLIDLALPGLPGDIIQQRLHPWRLGLRVSAAERQRGQAGPLLPLLHAVREVGEFEHERQQRAVGDTGKAGVLALTAGGARHGASELDGVVRRGRVGRRGVAARLVDALEELRQSGGLLGRGRGRLGRHQGGLRLVVVLVVVVAAVQVEEAAARDIVGFLHRRRPPVEERQLVDEPRHLARLSAPRV